MAKPTTMKGSHLLIMLGDGNSPENFEAPCGLTTKAFNLSAAVNDFNVPDCDDPDLPMWTERVISALSGTITGSGTLAMEALETWRTWFLSGAAKNIQVSFDELVGVGGGYYSMSAVLTGFNVAGNQGELATIEVEIQSNGEITWNFAAT